jgi:hypothetical protein
MSSGSSEPNESKRESAAPKVGRTRRQSIRLVWAVTAGEALLLGGASLVLWDYWLMLPVYLRMTGVIGLSILAAIGLVRLWLFYRKIK